MKGLNKVTLIGHLGKDPEVRYLDNGTAYANFSLATSENYTDKNGQKQTITDWHNIVLWRGLADVTKKYLHKGDAVYVEGKLQTRSWDDQNGNKRYTTEVVARDLIMLGGSRDGQQNTQTSYNQATASDQKISEPVVGTPTVPEDNDDLPF